MDERLQDLMGRVKATAATMGDLAGYGMQKAEEALNSAKLQMEIAGINGEISQRLKEVGQMVYSTHCGDLTDSAVLLEKLRQIDELKLSVRLRQQEMARMRGQSCCPHCGKTAQEGDLFCRDCGSSLH